MSVAGWAPGDWICHCQRDNHAICEECASYLLSMWKLASRSAVRLAVGDDPRTGFNVK